MENGQAKSVKITYLYQERDRDIYKSLHGSLKGLEREGLIKELLETRAGVNIQEKIKQRLDEAQIIILLLSAYFDREQLYNSSDMIEHIRKCKEKGTRIWPILVRHFHWKRSAFAKEYPLFFGEKDKPIMSWQSPDYAYSQFSDKVDKEITSILSNEWVYEGDKYYHQIDLLKAQSSYEQSLRYVPDNPYALLGQIRICYKSSGRDDAEALFHSLVLNASNTLQNKGNEAKSNNQLDDFTRCICTGYAHLELGRASEALRVFQEICQQLSCPLNDAQKRICAEAYYGAGDSFLLLADKNSDRKNCYERALAAYKKAQQLNSDEPKYIVGAGKASLALGDYLRLEVYYMQAFNDFEQCISRYPEYAPAYTGKGNTLYLMGRFEEALTKYNRAINLDQYEALAYNGIGYVLLKLDKWQEALSAFDKALEGEEKNRHSHYGRGEALNYLAQYGEALLAYDKARFYGFDTDDFLLSYAKVCQEQGRVEYTAGQKEMAMSHSTCAIKYYNAALQKTTNKKGFIYYNLGTIFFMYENWPVALQNYQFAINFNADKADAYLEAGRTCVELKQYEEALDYFERARSCYHDNESEIGKANIETAYGDTYSSFANAEVSDAKDSYYRYQEKAKKHYHNAITSYDQHAKAYLGLGKTYLALHDDPEKAMSCFNRAFELNPQLIECYFLKGKCYYALRKPLEAYSMYEAALKAGLNGGSLQISRGDVLLNMNRYREALQAFDDAAKFEGKEQAYTYCGKGMAFYEMQLYQEALQAFENADNHDDSICSKPRYKSILQDICIYFGRMMHDNPDVLINYMNHGKILLLLREHNRAIKVYTMAMTYDGTSDHLYRCRGLAYEREQEYQKAFDDYNNALAINPNCPWTRQRLKSVESKIVQPQTGPWQKIKSLLKLFS